MPEFSSEYKYWIAMNNHVARVKENDMQVQCLNSTGDFVNSDVTVMDMNEDYLTIGTPEEAENAANDWLEAHAMVTEENPGGDEDEDDDDEDEAMKEAKKEEEAE